MNRDDAPRSSRSPVPEGTGQVAAALVLAGISTYGFLVIGKHVVGGDAQFEPITTLWFAIFALAPGFFLPLEQELGRALSARRARGEGGLPVVRKISLVGLTINVAVLVVLALASRPIIDRYFDGNAAMLIALGLAFSTYAPAHLARGISAGEGRFKSYAIVISSDGVLRVIGAVIFLVAGVRSITAIAVLVALSPIAAVIFVWRRGYLHTEDGPEASWGEVNQNLGWLLLGSVFAAGLLNAGVIASKWITHGAHPELVTQFGYGVLLTRAPLFLYQAVQAALLPRLSRLATQGKFDEFKQGYRSLIYLVAGVGVVGVGGAFLLGPFIIDRVFRAQLTGRTLSMLALSSALYMAALATAQAVIALNGHRDVAIGWTLGFVGFIGWTAFSNESPFRRVEIALVLSSAIALVTFAFALASRLRRGVAVTPAAVWDALSDNPLET